MGNGRADHRGGGCHCVRGAYRGLHLPAYGRRGRIKSPFGDRIAHGLLGLSYLSGLITRLGILEGTVEAFMGVEMRFRKPIMFDDTVHAKVEVKMTRLTNKGQGLVTLGIKLMNQNEETVQEGEFVLMVARKE